MFKDGGKRASAIFFSIFSETKHITKNLTTDIIKLLHRFLSINQKRHIARISLTISLLG